MYSVWMQKVGCGEMAGHLENPRNQYPKLNSNWAELCQKHKINGSRKQHMIKPLRESESDAQNTVLGKRKDRSSHEQAGDCQHNPFDLTSSEFRIKMRQNSNLRKIGRGAPRTESGSTGVRSWDDLNYDVLVEIIKRVPWYYRLFVACLVSKAWLSAVLESMSTPPVMDLTIMDSPEVERVHRRYCCFLKRMVDNKPVDSWSSLILGDNLLFSHQYSYIAKRTPSLQQLVIPCSVGKEVGFIASAFRQWKKLKQVQCQISLIMFYPHHFRRVESLRVFGVVDDAAATAVRDRCPRLKRLALISCALSTNALSIILDGHKQLELLDTRHSFFVPDCKKIGFGFGGVSTPIVWNQDEILRRKGSGIKLHLMCDLHSCAQCAQPWKSCFPEYRLLPQGKGVKRCRSYV